MIDKLQPYLFLWQLPIIALYLLAWTFAGSYLLHRVAHKLLPERRKRIRHGRCTLVMLLVGATMTVSGLVAMLLVSLLSKTVDYSLTIPATVTGVVTAVAMGALCLHATFHFTIRQTARALLVSVGPLVLLAGVIATPTAGLAWHIRQRDLRRNISLSNLMRIRDALATYEQQELAPPPTLATLTRTNYISNIYLTAPVAPERRIGYFYVPGKWPSAAAGPDTIRICTFVSDIEDGRATLTGDGRCVWRDPDELAFMLARPENAAFAAALRNTEGH